MSCFLHTKKIAETMGEKLTVIRTADLGADKQAEISEYPGRDKSDHGEQRNPSLP